jgi:GT2 family glycosyltransferase
LRTLTYFADEEQYRPFEVIVVDQSDEPDPRVQEFLERNADLFRTIRRSEKSLPKSRNAGIESARGEIIVFVDDDVEVLPGFLGGHAAAFKDADVWGATGPVFNPGACEMVSAPLLTQADIAELNSGRKIIWNAGFEYDIGWLPGCNMSIRRSAFEKMGKFDEMYEIHCDDAEISHRIKLAGGRLRYTPAAKLIHYQRKIGGTRIDPVKSASYVRKYVRSLKFFELQLGSSAGHRTSSATLFRNLIISRQGYREGRMRIRQVIAFWQGVAAARREFNRRIQSSPRGK